MLDEICLDTQLVYLNLLWLSKKGINWRILSGLNLDVGQKKINENLSRFRTFILAYFPGVRLALSSILYTHSVTRVLRLRL